MSPDYAIYCFKNLKLLYVKHLCGGGEGIFSCPTHSWCDGGDAAVQRVLWSLIRDLVSAW